jgi:hypothetical protein
MRELYCAGELIVKASREGGEDAIGEAKLKR